MTRARCLIAATVAIVWMVCGAAPTFAQYNTAEVAGTVRDAQGGALAGVAVSATSTASGATLVRITDDGGRFFLPELAVGEYTITAERSGFAPFVAPRLMLRVGQRLDLSVTLQISELTDTVVVRASAPLLRTTTAEIADVIDNRQVQQLPLNGRQFIQLAQLTDGATIPPNGTRGAALGQAGPLPNIYGQRGGHNIYLLDGVKVTDEYFNNLVISPPVEAIQEFKIAKTQYPAEFGGKASALINVVTKSGTNRFHGSGLDFGRHEQLDARNYFDDPAKPIPQLRQQQFGINLGGPLKRNRTFFFLSAEGLRSRRAQTQTFSVPSDPLRTGDFSGLAPICDPTTRTATSCTFFDNNQIPATRTSPVATALLARLPRATSGGNVQNLLNADEQVTDTDQFTLKIDHRVGVNDQMYGRISTFRARDVQPFGTTSLNEALVPGFGRDVTTRSENVALGHTHTFGARWLNELRFGYLGARGGQVSPNQGFDFATASGLQGATRDPRDMGYPQVSFGGEFSTIGDPTSFVSRDDRSAELYDNVLFDRGNHHVKFGGYLFHVRFNPVNPINARGALTFTGQWTGNAFADFLLGYPSQAQVGIGRADEHGRSTWMHLYAQDDWRPTSNLTINYGLRYEINSEMTDVDNRLSAIDLDHARFVIASDGDGTMSPDAAALLGQVPISYTTSADAGWQRGLLRPSYRRFAPRLGIAWSPRDSEKTVIRAGVGVFLNQWAYSVQQALASTLPFFFAKSVSEPSDALQPTTTTSTALLAPANGSVSGSTMDWDFRTEYAKNYSLSVQHQLSASTLLEVSVLRSAIVGADSSTVRNVPEPGPGAIGPRRPVPQLANVTAIRWDGFSIFNGITLRAEQRLTRGLAMTAAYTRSKTIDDASDPGGTAFEANLPQDVRNMAAEEARASFDHAHRFVASAIYALPGKAGSGIASAITSDWQVSAIVLLESGAPFTVNLGTDRANIGAGPAQRPDQTCDPNQGAAKTATQWFNTSCFALQPQYTFGNAPRNSVLAPGYANVDLEMQKEVAVASGVRLQFRLEVFNLLNRDNFDVPSRVAFTSNFGRIFSAKPARQTQVGVKVLF